MEMFMVITIANDMQKLLERKGSDHLFPLKEKGEDSNI